MSEVVYRKDTPIGEKAPDKQLKGFRSWCILQLRGVRPFLSDKYDITQHPNYRYLSDADPKNAFDIGKFLAAKLKLQPDEQYEFFEYEPVEDEQLPDDDFDDYTEDLEPL